MPLEQKSEVNKKGSDSDKVAIRPKQQVPVRRKGTSLRARTDPNQQERTGLQRMGVKRSDAEGGKEMDAV